MQQKTKPEGVLVPYPHQDTWYYVVLGEITTLRSLFVSRQHSITFQHPSMHVTSSRPPNKAIEIFKNITTNV
ncbi:hypothetical protein E2C01_086982 [Portunus trituberculatus]|uniref:Uncharacterized protein n=1 Tax=Portunus trituberculatus TaxID=210409 RepID=A0A5B7JAT0_PORTR|nr:hypothetical protein [Portunus trituberculatus]